MTALLDTSVLVSGGGELDEPWVIGAVSVGELQAGVLLAKDDATRARRLRLLTAILTEAPIVPIDLSVSACYGQLRAATGRRSTNDLWIAATALAHDFTLLTADESQASLPLVRARRVG